MIKVALIKLNTATYLFIFIGLTLICIYMIYLMVKQKYTIFQKTTFIKYMLYMILANLLLIMLFFDVIEIYFITDVGYSSGMLWTLLNSLVMGMILLAVGVFGLKTGSYINYIIIILVVSLTISGLGYLGVRFVVNIPLFIWNIYDTNGIYGIWFYSLNSYLFIGLVFISTLFEKEKEY